MGECTRIEIGKKRKAFVTKKTSLVRREGVLRKKGQSMLLARKERDCEEGMLPVLRQKKTGEK